MSEPDLTTTEPRPVYVIGAGPGGLAVAAALRARGVRAVVVEKSGSVGASWRGHYERLHLHTTRRLSALPGLAIPRRFGRWVARADVVRYLEKYAEFHALEMVTGVEVTRIERAADGEGWTLHASGGRMLAAGAVVVATGFNHTPALPDWPGRAGYTGRLLHAAAYREPGPYAGQDVLVVGPATRAPRLPWTWWRAGPRGCGWRCAPSRTSCAARRPGAAGAAHGDPRTEAAGAVRGPAGGAGRAGLGPGPVGVRAAAAPGRPVQQGAAGAIPVQDVGLIEAVRRGRVEPVAAVASFDGDAVVLADGTRITPDAVIAATGYRRALEGLVGHLGVLDERGRPLVHGPRTPARAPGLYFTGFTNPISGMLRELARDAERIAKALSRRERRTRSRTGPRP
ncbi:Putative oxidoreductase CzcO OS=Streptomyces lavendulae subsp. lavendulae OX=58340 GN=czcO1 PE=4 SV=1 [Streptomyces lavendulae subsp. lavendulae]